MVFCRFFTAATLGSATTRRIGRTETWMRRREGMALALNLLEISCCGDASRTSRPRFRHLRWWGLARGQHGLGRRSRRMKRLRRRRRLRFLKRDSLLHRRRGLLVSMGRWGRLAALELPDLWLVRVCVWRIVLWGG
jgi:hypothetical protein